MNHIIPMRKERSTARLYIPFSFSPMTVWNQKMNSSTSITKPGSSAHAGSHSFRVATAPNIRTKRVRDP